MNEELKERDDDNIEIKLDEMVGTNKTKVDVSVAERSMSVYCSAGFSSLDGAWVTLELKN